MAPLKTRLVYPLRTTIAAVAALLVARAVGLREAHWAAISAVIVVQSDFGASLRVAWHRLAGTALGALVGAALAEFPRGGSVILFGVGVLCVGVLSVALRLDRAANRFGAIAFTIVFLLARPDAAWVVALHRFIDVSTGILAGLCLCALWPEKPATIIKA